MKLKTLILLNEFNAPGPMTSGNNDLIPWDGVTEGKGYFLYCGANDWAKGSSTATVCITEGKPKKFWLKVKTKGLRRPNDTNEGFSNRAYDATQKVGKAWVAEAKKLYKEPKSVDKVGNQTTRTLEEAFREALEMPRIKALIETWGESPIKQTQDGGTSAISDPVNFTPRV
jgi:hypothetical protein